MKDEDQENRAEIANFILGSSNETLESEKLAALLYKLRASSNFVNRDLPRIYNAVDVAVKLLTDLPGSTFPPGEWVSLVAALTGDEKEISDEWKEKWEAVSVDEIVDKKSSSGETNAGNIVDANAHIRHYVRESIITQGLFVKVLSEVWSTDIAACAKKFRQKNLDSININSDKQSSLLTVSFLKLSIWNYGISGLEQDQSTNIVLCSFARILKTSSEEGEKEDEKERLEACFTVHERIGFIFYHVVQKNAENRVATSEVFLFLLEQNENGMCLVRLLELFDEYLGWIDRNTSDLCKKSESLFWKLLDKLVAEIVRITTEVRQRNPSQSLKASETPSISFAYSSFETAHEKIPLPKNWLESMCEEIPAKMDKETEAKRFLQTQLDKLESRFVFVLEILWESKSVDSILNMINVVLPKLLMINKEDAKKFVTPAYRKWIANGVIPAEMQMSIADNCLESQDAVAFEILDLVTFHTPELLAASIAEKLFQNLLSKMKNADSAIYEKFERRARTCAKNFSQLLDKQKAIEFLHELFETLKESMSPNSKFNGSISVYAMSLFQLIFTKGKDVLQLKKQTAGETNKDEGRLVMYDFESLGFSSDDWDELMSYEATLRATSGPKEILILSPMALVPLLSHKQLTEVDLPVYDAIFCLVALSQLRRNDGKECFTSFYRDPKMATALDEFLSESHICQLQTKLIHKLTKLFTFDFLRIESNNLLNYVAATFSECINSLTVVKGDSEEFEKALIDMCNTIANTLVARQGGLDVAFDESDLVLDLRRCVQTSTMEYEEFAEKWDHSQPPSNEVDLVSWFGENSEEITREILTEMESSQVMERKFERLYCLSRVWRAKMVLDLPSVQTNVLGDFLRFQELGFDNKGPYADSEILNLDVPLRWNILSLKGISVHPSSILQLVLQQLGNTLTSICSYMESQNQRKHLVDWMLEASSCALYPASIATDACEVFNKLFAEKAGAMQRAHVLKILLRGASCKEPRQYYELKYTIKIFLELIKQAKEDFPHLYEQVTEVCLGEIGDWLDDCGSPDSNLCLTESAAHALTEIALKMGSESFKTTILTSISQRINLLEDWLSSTECPLGLFVELTPIISQFTLSPKTLENCVDIIFSTKAIQKMIGDTKVDLQCSEKRSLSALIYRADRASTNVPGASKKNYYREALIYFSVHGTETVHHRIIEKTIGLVRCCVENAFKGSKIISGDRQVTECANIVLYVAVLSEMLTYCVEISKRVGKSSSASEDFYSSDADENLEKEHEDVYLMNKKDPVGSPKTSLCTFSSTEQEFVNQHWYNCYTCSMTETMGVCSVCAINCHRGHDLSYSKEGQFFCDCGAAKCNSLYSTTHGPNVRDAVRGRSMLANAKSASTSTTANIYTLQHDVSNYGIFLESLNNLRIELDACRSQLTEVLKSVILGNEMKWKVESYRQIVLRSFCDLADLEIFTDNRFMEPYDVSNLLPIFPPRRAPESSGDRIKIKDIADVMKLENGTEIWFVLPEHTQATLLLYFVDTRGGFREGVLNARQETEQLPFVGRRLEVCKDRLVVCGLTEIIMFRFSSEGEFTDRMQVKICENGVAAAASTLVNPITKACWLEGDSTNLLIAVATVQFVRIYDLTLDGDRVIEELVLPLGNVEDIAFISIRGAPHLYVLSNSGFFYEQKLSLQSVDNSSFFLTNTITSHVNDHSTISSGSVGVSMYFSRMFGLMFLSFENGTFFARVPTESNASSSWMWKKLDIHGPVHCWRESSGVISCLVNPSNGGYHLYLSNEAIYVQKMSSGKTPMSHINVTGGISDCVYSVVFFCESPTIQITELAWATHRDLWIEDEMKEKRTLEMCLKDAEPNEIPDEDLVLLNEGCKAIERVEWRSKELAMFYAPSDLGARLAAVSSKPVIAIQVDQYTLNAKMLDQRVVVRGVRVEVPAERGPTEIKIAGKVYSLATTVARFFDIRLTRAQTYSLDHRDIKVEVRGRPGASSISMLSLRLLGASRSEMDEVRPIVIYQPALLLPQHFSLAVIEMYNQFATIGLTKETDVEWFDELCKEHVKLRNNHVDVVESALTLMRTVHLDDKAELYRRKDRALVEQFEWLMNNEVPYDSLGQKIRVDLLIQLLPRLKNALRSRWKFFLSALSERFENCVPLLKFLCRQMENFTPVTGCQIADVVTALVFGLLAQKANQSREITKLYLDLYTNDQTCRLAHLLRGCAESLLYKFAARCREDRNKCRPMNNDGDFNNLSKYIVLSNFGVRPFYNVTRVFEKNEKRTLNYDEIAEMMGDLCDPSEVCQRDLFDDEAEWMNDFIYSTQVKIRDEGATNSLPSSGAQIGTYDSPSLCLNLLAVVVMGQFNPLRLYDHVKHLIDTVRNDNSDLSELNEANYRKFLLVRLLSQLVLRWVGSEKREEEALEQSATSDGGDSPKETKPKRSAAHKFLEKVAAEIEASGVIDRCLAIVTDVLPYWRSNRVPPPPRRTWNQHLICPRQPRIVYQNHALASLAKKESASASLESYLHLLTDVALRLPLQITRITGSQLSDKWCRKLCELVNLPNIPVHTHCKKLLIAIHKGDKLKYRTMRDKFRIETNIELLKTKYIAGRFAFIPLAGSSPDDLSGGFGGYQQLTEMVDIMTAITRLANSRGELCREICEDQINWLLQVACRTTDVLSCSFIELILVAIRDTNAPGEAATKLADKIIGDPENNEYLRMIVLRYLIGKDEAKRWLVHGLLRSLIQLASRHNQASIARMLYMEMWPLARSVGMHGAQLVDLIATYASRLFTSTELNNMCEAEIKAIVDVYETLRDDGHADRYEQMVQLGIGWKTMLYSTSPCLVCFNRKGTTEMQKLNTIKQDTRFSANAMMYKLPCHYEISRVLIKLTDVKKTKTVKRINVYYCPKNVEAVVELKLNPGFWKRCASVAVAPNETEISATLAVPVITSSVIIEFAEIAEVRQTTDLHCPRCSAVVAAASGLCENCGENAYQCIKCRAINYDEKEPYLCQSCGFCKYARIDAMIACRQLPGAQHITCDSERAQCMDEMSRLLINIENSRSQLTTSLAFCEALWFRTRPLAPFEVHVENNHVGDYFATTGVATFPMNSFQAPVSALVQAANALKTVHDELCVQTQQLISLREELRRYDDPRKAAPILHSAINQGFYSTSLTCFGCLCASVLHALALLQATCDDESCVQALLDNQRLYEVIAYVGSKYEPLREEVQLLFCRLSADKLNATNKLKELIEWGRMDVSIFYKSLMTMPDSLWQHKLKFLVKYAMEKDEPNSIVMAFNVLNRYLENARPIRQRIYRKLAERRKDKYLHTGKKRTEGKKIRVCNDRLPDADAVVRWLTTDDEWGQCIATSSADDSSLSEDLNVQSQWIARCLFSPYCAVRSAASKLLVNLSRHPGHEGIAILLIVNWLWKLRVASPTISDQFVQAVHSIIAASANTKARLFVERLHIWLMRTIHKECKNMHKRENDESTMDHTFGSRLRSYVELLCLLFSGSCVENILLKAGGDDLMVPLLQSTIFLKRMVVRRTRAVDASRIALEKLLRRVSWRDGNKLMRAAIKSLTTLTDMNTQAHIVSVMLEVMDPQQKEEEDFFVQIEKDPAQEDFLQGRMTGNPYRSSDTGMGPLMRDIKNKICRDTEMVALLEDDNGMELLVNNMIVSLSLSVRAVHEKLWRRAHPGQPMLIVYRMRGLLGDAVEPFISSLGEVGGDEDEDDEALTKITRCLVEYHGLDQLLILLREADMSVGGRFLLSQLRRIFERIVKTGLGRNALVRCEATETMVKVLRICVYDDGGSQLMLGLDFFRVVEMIVSDAALHPLLKGVPREDALWLTDLFEQFKAEMTIDENGGRVEVKPSRSLLLETVSRSIGNVVLGSAESEDVLIADYPKVFCWKNIDHADKVITKERNMWHAEQLANITWHILPTAEGSILKDKILASGVVKDTCDYLTSHHPSLFTATESAEWKQFLVKPSLKLMLVFLRGLVRGHEASQKAVAATTLPILHRLENVATENSIGTLAENVIEALKENPEVAQKIEAVRQETKQKKRQLAMAMRSRQLNKMGMQIGKGGEVMVSSRLINEPALEDDGDNLLICCICRESLCTGTRTSAVYAFASVYDEADVPAPPVMSTVSQMVMVHFDCHNNAIRRTGVGRSMDEWAKASLHNAGAKCNVMTPISLGKANDEEWLTALSKYHNDFDRVSHGITVATRSMVLVDMYLLIDRFIFQRSFSEKSQGGGRESNMQYLAILHLLGMSQSADNELIFFQPRHRIASFLFTELTVESWNEQKHDFLRAALNDITLNNEGATWVNTKPTFFMWAFVDKYFNDVIPITGDDRLEWMRTNLRQTLLKTMTFVQNFDNTIMKTNSLAAFCEAAGLPIEQYTEFVSDSNV